MKKLIIILFVVLGITIKISAQIKTSKNSSFEKQAILTADKSKLFILHIVEEKIITSCLRKQTEQINRITDTVRIFSIIGNARNYINDSITFLFASFTENQKATLPDSLVPRWTHLFGEETYIKRELRIVGDDILFFDNVGIKKTATSLFKDFWLYPCILSIFLLISSYVYFFEKKKTDLFELFFIHFLLLFLFLLGTISINTFFDIFLLCLIIEFPSFLVFLISKNKKEKQKQKNLKEYLLKNH